AVSPSRFTTEENGGDRALPLMSTDNTDGRSGDLVIAHDRVIGHRKQPVQSLKPTPIWDDFCPATRKPCVSGARLVCEAEGQIEMDPLKSTPNWDDLG